MLVPNFVQLLLRALTAAILPKAQDERRTSVDLYDVYPSTGSGRLVEKRAQGTGNTNCAGLLYARALRAALWLNHCRPAIF